MYFNLVISNVSQKDDSQCVGSMMSKVMQICNTVYAALAISISQDNRWIYLSNRLGKGFQNLTQKYIANYLLIWFAVLSLCKTFTGF